MTQTLLALRKGRIALRARAPTQKNPDFPELSSSIVHSSIRPLDCQATSTSKLQSTADRSFKHGQDKKAQAGNLTRKAALKRLDALAKKLEEELKDADLFAPLPPTEDCPICCLPLSRIASKILNRPCCGKDICAGCDKEHEVFIEVQNAKNAGKKGKKLLTFTCPFCREPKETLEEQLRRTEARAAKNDHYALSQLGMTLIEGNDGAPKDEFRGLDCWIRAAELTWLGRSIWSFITVEVATMCCLSITKDSCHSQKLAL